MTKRTQSNRTHRRKQRQDRNLRIRSVRRNPLDYKKLAGALIELAMAQSEADVQAEDERKKATRQRRTEHRQEKDQHDDSGGGPA